MGRGETVTLTTGVQLQFEDIIPNKISSRPIRIEVYIQVKDIHMTEAEEK